MDNIEQYFDSLNKIIKLQDELLANLRAEIERLKSTPVVYGPPVAATLPYIQSPQPTYPSGPPPSTYPSGPQWISPLTTIPGIGTISGGTLTGLNQCSHEFYTYGDEKSGGQWCKKCGFGNSWSTNTNLNITTSNISSNSDVSLNPTSTVLTACGYGSPSDTLSGAISG